jgi:ActR/RegA family two-component response regulator
MSKRNRILVVDDDERWLNTISMILKHEYDLVLKSNPAQAIKLLRTSDFDLVILDKQLLGISGLEVYEQVRTIAPEMRVIMLTGYADVDSAVEIMKSGALDYIDKGTGDLSSALKSRVADALRKSVRGSEIKTLIEQGESAELEFKSSVRWDFKENRLNTELERVVVRTVAAMMNSRTGGTVLIGVDDSGMVVGLKNDYKTIGRKQNRDGYENFLTTLLLTNFGKDCSPLIKILFHMVEGKDVCQIDVKPSFKPQFVKDARGEHFHIRAGNSTRLLSTREAIEYCKIRWERL